MKPADCRIRSCRGSSFPEDRGVCTDTLFRRPDFVRGNAVTIGWLLLLLTTVLLWLLRATPVRAAGVVGTGTPESCTEAALDAALAGGGLVTFDCGAKPVTIILTAEKVITEEMDETIVDGGGLVTLSGGRNGPGVHPFAFYAYEGGTLEVQNLAIYGRGGIINSGTLRVTNCTFSENEAGPLDGGGILNGGTLTVTNSTFSGNSADSDSALGGGIANFGMLTVTNSTFSENDAYGGGGIANFGTLRVTNCAFSENEAGPSNGGGILNGGTLTVTNSTFSGNSASGGEPHGGAGGGIYNGGTLTVTNSTFSGNGAGFGGGIYNFSNNELIVTNTIIANNIGGDCNGTVTDGGHNLIGDAENACGLTDGLNGNIVGVDPMLDPGGLADNGGPTETIALLAGSPAIDAGDPEVCADPPVNGLDQRGYVRPGTGSTTCSIGAYEFDSPGPPPCTGDCDENGAVQIHELVTLLNIGLGIADVSGCEAGDRNLDGEISIDEILSAVSHDLTGCPGGAHVDVERLKAAAEAETNAMVSFLSEAIRYQSVEERDAPLTAETQALLDFTLDTGASMGYKARRSSDGKMGILEYGDGAESVGVIAHLDVTLAGDASKWEHPPFGGVVADGRVYGRGAIDDKGGVVAALWGGKLLIDEHARFDRQLRILLSTKEEVSNEDWEAYFAEEAPPDFGIVPDGANLVIAQNGYIELTFSFPNATTASASARDTIVHFGTGPTGGVPDEALAVIETSDVAAARDEIEGLIDQLPPDETRLFFEQKAAEVTVVDYEEYASTNDVSELPAGDLVVVGHGEAVAHSSRPWLSRNAVAAVALVASGMTHLNDNGLRRAVELVGGRIGLAVDASFLGLSTDHPAGVWGNISNVNSLMVDSSTDTATVRLTVRHQVPNTVDDVLAGASALALDLGATIEHALPDDPIFFPEDHPLPDIVDGAYTAVVGAPVPRIAVTYWSQSFAAPNHITFGPVFAPGDAAGSDAVNEWVSIAALTRNAAIYANVLQALVQVKGAPVEAVQFK